MTVPAWDPSKESDPPPATEKGVRIQELDESET